MLHHAAVEVLSSTAFLADYLNTVETLPDDLQRNISLMRELHVQNQEILEEIKLLTSCLLKENGSFKLVRHALTRALISCQEIGDERIALAQLISDLIENKSRQLEQDRESLVSSKEAEVEVTSTAVKRECEAEKLGRNMVYKRTRRHKIEVIEEEPQVQKDKTPKQKKANKMRKKEESCAGVQMDPNEPTYCVCRSVSYGEMIGCDNEKCVVEWFHFACVGLRAKPKGKWFCPECRGDKPNVKKI